MKANARVMVPVTITPAMILAGTTIAEPDLAAGEVAWVASGTYALADRRTDGGSVWECVKVHNGRAARPADDPQYWLHAGPTNRQAAFDDYGNTKTRATGSLTLVLQPGFINGIKLYEIEGSAYAVTLHAEPGGALLKEWSGDLYAQAAGLYELLFTPLLQQTQLAFDDVPITPKLVVTITITSAPGQPVAVGVVKLGDWRTLIGEGDFGGVQYGAEAQRKSYTFREYGVDGAYKIVRRPASRDVRCSVVIDANDAMYADALLGEIIDMAVPFEASGLPRYGYLNTIGFVSGSIRADTFGTTSLNLEVKGNI